MFSLTIKTPSSPSVFFLMELLIQCKIARRAYSVLAEFSRAEVAKDWDAIRARPMGAIEVMAECAVFLSSAGIIAKVLFPGERSSTRSKLRGTELRSKLCVTDFPNLSSTSVRNSFEHIDDRLDTIIRDYNNHSICQIHVAIEEPANVVMLRRFDPVELTISFLGDTLDLKRCNDEITELQNLIPEAMGK
jgi:hypothetical protein